MEKFKEAFAKIPFVLIMVIVLGWFAWDYSSFTQDESSPLNLARKEIEAAKSDNERLQSRVKQGVEFVKTLEAKKAELRKLSEELNSMKGTLSETLDVPDFMKTVLAEAKHVGLTVVRLQPAEPVSKEFYQEQPFDFTFRGVYVQLTAFLERMSGIQKIVRVDNFNIRPVSPSNARFVTLEGTVQVKAYRYLASKADEVGKNPAGGSGAAPGGAARPGAPGGAVAPATPPKSGGGA